MRFADVGGTNAEGGTEIVEMDNSFNFGIELQGRPVPQPFVYRYAIQHPWYDGDSPKIILDRGMYEYKHEVACRLYGVDTPEMRGDQKVQGKSVRDIVRSWCPVGSEGVLVSHKDGTGKYGRLLVSMWPDGWEMSINERLFHADLAVIKTYDAKTDAALASLWAEPFFPISPGSEKPTDPT